MPKYHPLQNLKLQDVPGVKISPQWNVCFKVTSKRFPETNCSQQQPMYVEFFNFMAAAYGTKLWEASLEVKEKQVIITLRKDQWVFDFE